MSKPRTIHPARQPRREFLQKGAALGAASALPSFAWAQGDDLTPYRSAKVNWRQAEGQEITVAVIPASYFDNLITLQPQFEALMAELDQAIAEKEQEVLAAEDYLDQALFLLGEECYANRIADPELAVLYPRIDRAN